MFACIYSSQIPAEVSLADFAYSFSPVVEETDESTAIIDVEGCALQFGSPYELATTIAQQARLKTNAGGLDCKVNVALAANADTASYAARNFQGVTFIAPGEELEALGDLPVEKLPIANCQLPIGAEVDEIFNTLRLWGVRTFKEFAELPVAGVSERLGQLGLKLQQLAGGKTNRHLKVRQPAPEFKNAIELDYPIAELESLSFIFARLLNQICANLNAYALATNLLQVELKLERGGPHQISLNLPYPMRDHKVFLKLLLLNTEMHPPPAAIMGIALSCEPVKPRVLQSGLFIPLAPEPEKLELMLARLAKLVGPENIGSPELLDTHRPDAFRLKRFELKERKKSRRSTVDSPQSRNRQSAIGNQQSFLGFRYFRPALRALVQTDGGRPLEISAWSKNKSVYGKIVSVAGPWRTSGDWWRTDMWARDEWDVAVEGRRQSADGSRQKADVGKSRNLAVQTCNQVLYRIYRELKSGVWFVEGVYD